MNKHYVIHDDTEVLVLYDYPAKWAAKEAAVSVQGLTKVNAVLTEEEARKLLRELEHEFR